MALHSLNRNELMKISLKTAGRIGDNEIPTNDQYQKAGEVINMILSNMMNVAQPLIQMELKSTSVSTASFSLEAEDEDILNIYKSASDVDDPSLTRLSYDDYYGGISDKTDTGTPCSYYVDYQATRTVYLYPVPSSATTIKYLALKRFQALTASTDIPLDNRYYLYLMYEAAAILCDIYNGPLERCAWLKSQAKKFKVDVKSKDMNRFDSTKKGSY